MFFAKRRKLGTILRDQVNNYVIKKCRKYNLYIEAIDHDFIAIDLLDKHNNFVCNGCLYGGQTFTTDTRLKDILSYGKKVAKRYNAKGE